MNTPSGKDRRSAADIANNILQFDTGAGGLFADWLKDPAQLLENIAVHDDIETFNQLYATAFTDRNILFRAHHIGRLLQEIGAESIKPGDLARITQNLPAALPLLQAMEQQTIPGNENIHHDVTKLNDLRGEFHALANALNNEHKGLGLELIEPSEEQQAGMPSAQAQTIAGDILDAWVITEGSAPNEPRDRKKFSDILADPTGGIDKHMYGSEANTVALIKHCQEMFGNYDKDLERKRGGENMLPHTIRLQRALQSIQRGQKVTVDDETAIRTALKVTLPLLIKGYESVSDKAVNANNKGIVDSNIQEAAVQVHEDITGGIMQRREKTATLQSVVSGKLNKAAVDNVMKDMRATEEAMNEEVASINTEAVEHFEYLKGQFIKLAEALDIDLDGPDFGKPDLGHGPGGPGFGGGGGDYNPDGPSGEPEPGLVLSSVGAYDAGQSFGKGEE